MGGTKKITHLGVILISNFILKAVFEWGLVPLLMIELGFLKTLLITILFLFLFGFLSIKIYDFYKKDYLLIEALKESQKNKTNIKRSSLINMILKWTTKNKFWLGLFLSSQNPGLFVLYYREGLYLYDGIKDKKLKIFFIRNILILSLYLNIFLYLSLRVFIN